MDDTAKTAKKFVVLTSQRTGSTLLVRSLDASPRILCAGEIFHTGTNIQGVEFQYPRTFIGSIALGKLRDAVAGRSRIRRHLSGFYAAGGREVEAIGFKLMLSQVRQLPAILPELDRAGAQLLFLYRDDSLAAALSNCRARATSVYHSDRIGATRAKSDVTISDEEFERTLKRCQRDKRQLIQWQSANGGYLMRYEDMAADWVSFVERLGNELGIAGLRIPMALDKLTQDRSAIRIANEADLLEKFRAYE